jgi:hypothetical protein
MITLFTTAKPFTGHSAVIQRNALKSWTLLHPDVEVILFGDDQGTGEVCAEFHLRHEPHVERNSSGLKRIDYYWDRAQQIARHDILCYANCDIIFTSDLVPAIRRASSAYNPFLMVGRRWDTDLTAEVDFTNPSWAVDIRHRAALARARRDRWWIDYFVFSRGLFLGKLPPLVIGRVVWDNFLIWRAADLGATVIDASSVVQAIHQNHDYRYHPLGKQGVWNDQHAQENLRNAGGPRHMRSIADASVLLTPRGFRANPVRHWLAAARALRPWRYSIWNPIWFLLLDFTRPARHFLGLRASRKGSGSK